jgi:predicted O-linked N-acetylglucosamine transferase (SPINDLY family)
VSEQSSEQLFEQALERHEAGDLGKAEALYRKLLESNPRDADVIQMLGMVKFTQGQLDSALDLLKQAVEINPTAADYHYHLGKTLLALKKPHEAIAAFEAAIALENNFHEAHLERGKILETFGKLEAAVADFRRVVDLEPDLYQAWEHLTDSLRDLGRLEEARAAGQKGVELRPDSPDALTHLGAVLHFMARYDEAITQFQQALKLDPTRADACANLANAYFSAWDIPQSLVYYRKSVSMRPVIPRFGSNLLYALHFQDDLSPTEMLNEHVAWARRHTEPLRSKQKARPNDRSESRRLRIGYVSPDFRAHSVNYFIENLLAHHDAARFETFCYADTLNPDAITARIKPLAHHWHDTLGLDNLSLVDLIRQNQIDILVDLAGHTANHRLLAFARKPAPIQITYLGYPDTTGMPQIDYRFTDAHADPPGNTGQLYTEKLFYLDPTFLCYRPSADSPAVSPLPALQNNLTFGSLNHLPKLNPHVIETWAQILHRIPQSRLLIKSVNGLQFPPTHQRLMDLFTSHDINPSRIILRPGTPSPVDHLKTYHEIDIALDTFPYGGTTTTCEALWMGVPVIILAGQRHTGRVGVSLLSNAGLPDLIARDPQHYIDLAVQLAADLPRLQQLRAGLRPRMTRSPLLDARQFAQNVEAAYDQMWRQWLKSPEDRL